ncbi:MAG TPA: Trk family potassium uptake protein [Ruminococcaceae bacterium]|mgnify:CR=1 FL=1|nr:Trk family potassium uptake protein [Oscillospiraceae bacterium]
MQKSLSFCFHPPKNVSRAFHIKPVQTVAISFAAVIFCGAILLTLPIASKSGQSLGFLTALFTSTSATCVTGLVVVDTYTSWTLFGQIVILALIQIGGLGFMIVATTFALALGQKISLKERMILAESINRDDLQGVVSLTRKILIGTFVIEGTGAALLSIRFIPKFGVAKGIYFGIFHSISAFCNAGFDIMGGYSGKFSNLGAFAEDPLVSIVIMSLIVIGGLGFAVLSDIISRRGSSPAKLRLHTKLVLVTTGALLLFGFLFFFFAEYNNPKTLGSLSCGGKILAAMFMSVTPRTAGFNTINLASMRVSSIFVTIFLMFVGASPGSTAGGIKTTTFATILLTVASVFKGREDVEAFQKKLPRSLIKKAFVVAFIGLMQICIVTTVLVSADHVDLMSALYETTSAFGTVGLTLGITSKLSAISHIALIITMYFGRVGILSIILAISNRSERGQAKFSFPEEKIAIG